MSISELTKKYFVDGPYNCAETLLLKARDELGIEIRGETIKALGTFGGGMGCGELCGAIAAACAVIGIELIEENSHGSPNARAAAAKLTKSCISSYGSIRCAELKPKYFRDGMRCGLLVDDVAARLKNILAEESAAKSL